MYIIFGARIYNSWWPLAIFQPISAFGRPKSILVSHISCKFSMEQQIISNKISYLQKQPTNFWSLFLVLNLPSIVSNPTTCSYLFIIISYKTKCLFTLLLSLVAVHTCVAVFNIIYPVTLFTTYLYMWPGLQKSTIWVQKNCQFFSFLLSHNL